MGYFEKQPQSYWTASADDTGYDALDHDERADVAIIGGGIAGIMSAYFLTLEGLSVAVIEAGRILRGTTGHTTGKLTSQHELIYDKLICRFGRESAQQYADANETAIRTVERISREKGIDCDLASEDAFVFAQNEGNLGKIEKEIKAADSLGINAEFASSVPFDLEIKGAVRFLGQARFHPLKFLLPLAEEAVKKGARIYENSRAMELEEGGRFKVAVENGSRVAANFVIIASHYPFLNKEGFYFARLYTDRSYILALRAKEKYPGGMYINAGNPSRSLRSQPSEEGELILVAGEQHKTGQGGDTSVHYDRLKDFADRLFTIDDIPYRWSAQDCMTLDGVPYAGMYKKDTPGLFVATGFGKWGMTNSIASAMLIKDLITRGDSPWKEVYDPSRKVTLASVGNFVVQGASVAGHFIGGKLTPLPEGSDIEKGEAKVVLKGGRRVGAYRDAEGKLHLVDTTCTHMGCELKWNSAEKTWDCPCHGSRFSVDGDIVEGPATNPLDGAGGYQYSRTPDHRPFLTNS